MQIDNSQLQTYKDCPRHYYNKFILKLKKISYDERELDKDFGKCIHKALAILYEIKDLEKVKKWWIGNFHGLQNEKCKTPANGLQLLEWYRNYYSDTKNELSDTHLTTLGIEIKDEFELDKDITYIVKIDRIVNSQAGIWIMEHKTTTMIPNNYFYQFDPNSQVSGYCYYCKLKYEQCSGLIVNAMSMGHRERSYKGEPAGFHAKFVREIINRNNEQLTDWLINTRIWIRKLQKAIEDNIFPRNESACHQFRGCAFKELCISCDDEQIKNELYEIDPDPLKYLNE
jgi:hypothetical protein